MKHIFLTLMFLLPFNFGVVGQDNTTSYATEYELAHWAEKKHDILTNKIIEKMYSYEFVLYDSSGIKLDTSQVRKVLYYEYITKASSQKDNYEPILKIDSVSGNVSIHYKKLRETDPDSLYDTLVQIKNLQYSYSLVFKEEFVGIRYTKKPEYMDDYVYIRLRDFNSLLDKELNLYIQYFKKSSMLHYDSITLESNRIMRNLNYKVASHTISGKAKVYSDNKLTVQIKKNDVSKIGMLEMINPKDTLPGEVVVFDTLYIPITEDLPNDFSQLYFVYDKNFKLVAFSSFYYMKFGGIIIGNSSLGFIKSNDALTFMKEDKTFLLTLIDYATKLKLSEFYNDEMQYIKKRSNE